ncbi:MAG: nuclear transport factor 2 family protein [Acidobacteria bacterium]|nr:nuclear transport factor 2 family protein [Acidobacteriota bacterium]
MKKALGVSAVLLFMAVHLPGAYAQTAADREAIHELMWRYSRAFEALDPDTYVSLFAKDGRFGTTQGHDGLRAMIEKLRKSRSDSPREYLLITDAWIEFIDDTHARHHHYWMTIFAPAKQGASPNVSGVGRGIDELVKIDGKWLIQTRLAPQQ